MSMSSACPLSPALPSHACISILHFSFLFPPFPLSVPAPYPAHVRRPPNLGSPPLAHLLLNRPCDALIPSLPPDVVRSHSPACAFASRAWQNHPSRPLAIRPHIHVKRLPSHLCLAIPRTHIHPSPVLPLPALCYCTLSRPFPTPPSPNILTPSACAPPPQLALRRPYPFLATRRCQVPFSNLFVSFPRLAKPSFPPLAFRPHIHLKPRSSDPCLAIHTCMAILHLSCRSPPFGIRGSAHYGAFFLGGESEP